MAYTLARHSDVARLQLSGNGLMLYGVLVAVRCWVGGCKPCCAQCVNGTEWQRMTVLWDQRKGDLRLRLAGSVDCSPGRPGRPRQLEAYATGWEAVNMVGTIWE